VPIKFKPQNVVAHYVGHIAEENPPQSPFIKGGSRHGTYSPLFEKEGLGEISFAHKKTPSKEL